MYETHYQYEPWFTQDDRTEIPSFTVYLNGEPIAFTNENRPKVEQEEAARVFVASWQLLEAVEQFLDADGDLYAMDFAAARAAIAAARGKA